MRGLNLYRQGETVYFFGNLKLGDGIEFHHYDTVEKIVHQHCVKNKQSTIDDDRTEITKSELIEATLFTRSKKLGNDTSDIKKNLKYVSTRKNFPEKCS